MTDEQIVGILQEAEKGEKKIADLCREKGISANTFYVWKRKFGALQISDVKRLRELERENARLKRLEHLLIGSAAFIIALLISLVVK